MLFLELLYPKKKLCTLKKLHFHDTGQLREDNFLNGSESYFIAHRE